MTDTASSVATQRVEAVRTMLAKAVDDGYFAGVAACAVQHGQLLHRDAFGFRDVEEQEPMTTDTIFRIASSTKPIIAVAMMILHEEGRWDFDDPVTRFIPSFEGLKVQTKDDGLVEPVQPMLMRHLMSHAAGFGAARAAAGGQPTPSRPAGMQGLIDRLSDQPLAFHPGKRFLYGPCCDVQGHVIEQLSGQTLDVFLRERVFDPLGMVDTGFWVEPAATDRVASLYDYRDGERVRVNRPDREQITRRPSFLSGGGGLWSTPDDYQRFCQMLLDEGAAPDGRIMRPETVRRMRDDLLEPQVYVRVVAGYTLPGTRFGTNVAVITEPQGDFEMYGRDTYTWGGAFGTYFWVDPANDLFVSGMVQISNGGAQHLGMKLPYPDLKMRTAQLLYRGG